MLEMSEAAAILKKATPRSLVLIDEIGRGTSAAEGLALASAIAKHLIHSNRSCVLFATHYHEIIKSPLLLAPINIESTFDNSSYIQMACTDAEIHDDGSVVLIPKVRSGVATHSYALPVAALAGIPESVITDAKHQLDRLKTL
jgi:DNA mismatch repair protein MutS